MPRGRESGGRNLNVIMVTRFPPMWGTPPLSDLGSETSGVPQGGGAKGSRPFSNFGSLSEPPVIANTRVLVRSPYRAKWFPFDFPLQLLTSELENREMIRPQPPLASQANFGSRSEVSESHGFPKQLVLFIDRTRQTDAWQVSLAG